MLCLYTEKLLQYFHQILPENEKYSIQEHILSCDTCFEEYYFLVQLESKEQSIFSKLETKISIRDNLEFIIHLNEEDPINSTEITVVKENISVQRYSLMTRSNSPAYLGFKVEAEYYPTFFLFQESKPSWILYLEEEILNLSLLIDDKVHYQADYQAKELILLPSAKKYTLIRDNDISLSFKLC